MQDQKSPCVGCIYYGKSTGTCDYILIEDHSRPCPPGPECTVRRTVKEVKKVGKPRWDTELGRLLWLEDKSDAFIASEMGVAVSTVAHQRRKWERNTPRPESTAETQQAASPPETPEAPEVPETKPKAPPCEHVHPGWGLQHSGGSDQNEDRYRSDLHGGRDPLSLELGQRRRSTAGKSCHQSSDQAIGGLIA